MDAKELKYLLTKSLDEAFKAIKTLVDESNVKNFNDYTHLQSWFNDVEKRNLLGTLSAENYRIEMNMLRQACLGLIDEIGPFIDVEHESVRVLSNNVGANKIYVGLPRLDIELIKSGGYKKPIGLSRNNVVDENGAIWATDAIYINEIEWKYQLMIRNNSSYPAYYPEINIPNNSIRFQFINHLNKNVAVLPHQEIELKVKFVQRLEAKGRDAVKYMQDNRYLEGIGQVGFELTYQSEEGQELKTLYTMTNAEGKNERVMPIKN